MEHFGSELLASQGFVMGREGLLHLSLSDTHIRVGGDAVTCIDGMVAF